MGDSLLPFLAAVALGAYAQAVTGFALGIFVLAGVVILDVSSISVTATALNIMTLATGTVVVLPRLRKVHWKIVAMTASGLIPAMVVGVLALNYLSAHAQVLLRLLLGMLIVAGGLILIWKPQPRKEVSAMSGFLVMGALGGILGGLFSVPAPPLVYQLYRQPLLLVTIRTTMISLFCIMGIGRLVVVGAQGHIGLPVLQMGASAVPVVVAAAWLGNRYPPRISDKAMRRGVFALLMVVGVFIIVSSLP